MIKVLIVEDDPMVSELNSRYVSKIEGFEVLGTARDGEEALSMIKEQKPQLIILDIYMPKLNGIKLLKEIRKQNIRVDAILVTAARDVESIDEILKLGAVDYLVKPFEFQRFKLALEGYKGRLNTLSAKERISQKDIDMITIHGKNKDKYQETDKGIYRRTLDSIKIYLKEQNSSMSAIDIATNLGVSRVTARRYLEYLADIGEVEVEISYGTIGRPQHLYSYKQ